MPTTSDMDAEFHQKRLICFFLPFSLPPSTALYSLYVVSDHVLASGDELGGIKVCFVALVVPPHNISYPSMLLSINAYPRNTIIPSVIIL